MCEFHLINENCQNDKSAFTVIYLVLVRQTMARWSSSYRNDRPLPLRDTLDVDGILHNGSNYASHSTVVDTLKACVQLPCEKVAWFASPLHSSLELLLCCYF